MMTCRALLEQLDDLVANVLSPEERCDSEDHLRACPPCAVMVETYQITIRLTRQLGPCLPSEDKVRD